MKRDEWKFEFNAETLSSAAKDKAEIHNQKRNWWEQKKAEVMQKIKDSGIEVQDSVAASYSNTKGSFGPQIKIDAGLQRDLTECQDKIMQHHNKNISYAGWFLIMSKASPDDVFDLDYEDWLYFFGN